MLTVMSLNLRYGAGEDRWTGMAPLIREVSPQVLFVQEAVGWADDGDNRLAIAERDLGMRGQIAPSRTGFHTGILINEKALTWGDWNTTYNHTSLHGHAELTVTAPGFPTPLVLISAHLNPYSAALAAGEVSVLIGRAHRTGSHGIIAGDINHIPPGDLEPPWDEIPAHDRSARSVVEDPVLRANHIVGQTLTRGRLVDVAAHLADQRNDLSLRAWTGHIGKVRTDQAHITEQMVPALVDYWTVPMAPYSDHDGVVVRLDLDQLNG
jgi:endonuclease/exonuclease/phosphatase family metal-dependent hydrolase